jgi:HemK-related putative methylase
LIPKVFIVNAHSNAVQTLLRPSQYGRLRRSIGKLIHWRYRLLQQGRHEQAVLERFAGMTLLVTPGVLNPRLVRTGAFFASKLTPELIGRDSDVLDMGTGSGVCAIVAAKHARSVVAVDINPAAVRCARINALLNRVDARIEVLSGDLYAPLSTRQFDVILFNPPFVRGLPRNDADRAWRSNDVADRFARDLRSHLRPDGYALVLLSTYGQADDFIQEFQRHGFAITVMAQRSFINERLAILKLA